MKILFKLVPTVVLALVMALTLEPLMARGLNRGDGRGGGQSVKRPQPRPAASRPKQARPATPPKGRPAHAHTRPSPKPAKPRPVRPPSGGRVPSKAPQRPQTKPSQRPGHLPSNSTRPTKPRPRPPVTKPAPKPSKPVNRPGKPGQPSNRPGKPSNRPGKPENRPGNGVVLPPAQRPTLPSRPGRPRPPQTKPTPKPPGVGDRPGRPGQPGGRPDRPGKPGKPGGRPDKPVKPGDRPGKPGYRPGRPENRPGIGNRPGRPGNRPGIGNRPVRPVVPPPSGRPVRPQRPAWDERWNGRDHKFTNVNNNWYIDNRKLINRFEADRARDWRSVRYHWRGRDWRRHWGDADYRRWRKEVWRYRGNRGREIWYRTAPLHYHNHFFNRHWWGTCWWNPRPVVYQHYSPWWWWRPLTWASVGSFWGASIQARPVVYDPGTTVVYEGDTVYINGNSAGNADDYRRQTIALANPELEEIPVPAPPEEVSEAAAESDQPQGDWLPVGVWALTQQEQGDATMFFQMSIDKEGIVAGAYKNVMTGDEQPIIGRLDFETQRLAWHVGDVTSTVYETGLSQLQNDVASVFVHFGETQTQTWLMVRMPSPEMPPGAVKLPEVVEED